MKNNIIILIIAFILVILLITSLVVHYKNEKEEPTLEDKVSEEISYLNNYLLSLLGNFNGLTLGNDISDKLEEAKQLEKEDDNTETTKQGETQESFDGEGKQENSEESTTQGKSQNNSEQQENNNSDTNRNQNSILLNKGKYQPHWTKIQTQTEQLYQIWNTISIDLHGLNIDGKSILAFSDKLNATTQYIKKQEKTKAIQELADLYKLLPQYRKNYQPNSEETKMLEIQSQVVVSYTSVSNEEWQDAEQYLIQAEQQFSSIINTVSENKKNQTTINQCYILVNELRGAVILKDKEIFYIQFQNLINKMTGLL